MGTKETRGHEVIFLFLCLHNLQGSPASDAFDTTVSIALQSVDKKLGKLLVMIMNCPLPLPLQSSGNIIKASMAFQTHYYYYVLLLVITVKKKLN